MGKNDGKRSPVGLEKVPNMVIAGERDMWIESRCKNMEKLESWFCLEESDKNMKQAKGPTIHLRQQVRYREKMSKFQLLYSQPLSTR
jgi:hypothetical protein